MAWCGPAGFVVGYLITAERMQGHGHPGRKDTYAKALAAFEASAKLGGLNRERVDIPLANGTMTACDWSPDRRR